MLKGDYKKLLGSLETTGARRKHQILNTVGQYILKLQKHAFVNWSESSGFFNVNSSDGFLEMKYFLYFTCDLAWIQALIYDKKLEKL